MYLKRLLAFLCCFTLVFCLFPSSAFATGGNGNIDGGGGSMGHGTSSNFWNSGNDGVRITVSGVKNVVLLIGGVIGAVFALVGLINFINLVMTNIITRRHEFATMQSIGMTNQQLRKMMISESFSYVLLAGIVGTLAAGVLGMTLVRAFVDISPSSIMMTFQMTLLPALIMLVLFLVLAFIVPVIALRLFNNRSVVERLRVNE